MGGDILLMEIIGELFIVHAKLDQAIEQEEKQDEENEHPDNGLQDNTSNL